MWRLDVGASSGSYAAPTRIATLTNADGNAQPVTTRPLIEVDAKANRRFVLVGSGLMLDNEHVASAAQQSFYALVDGTATAIATAPSASGVVYPVTRAALADNTNLLDSIVFDPASQAGWYIELGLGAQGNVGWRVINDPSAAFGIVTFTATLPSADACNPSGKSRVYAVSLGTGKSALTTPSGEPFINYWEDIEGLVTDLRFFSVQGKPRLIAGSDTGILKSVPGVFSTPLGPRRLNWRQVPIGN